MNIYLNELKPMDQLQVFPGILRTKSTPTVKKKVNMKNVNT